jgi:hypothetical protein
MEQWILWLTEEAQTEHFLFVFVKLMSNSIPFPSSLSVLSSFSNSALLHGWSNTTLMPVISEPVIL